MDDCPADRNLQKRRLICPQKHNLSDSDWCSSLFDLLYLVMLKEIIPMYLSRMVNISKYLNQFRTATFIIIIGIHSKLQQQQCSYICVSEIFLFKQQQQQLKLEESPKHFSWLISQLIGTWQKWYWFAATIIYYYYYSSVYLIIHHFFQPAVGWLAS